MAFVAHCPPAPDGACLLRNNFAIPLESYLAQNPDGRVLCGQCMGYHGRHLGGLECIVDQRPEGLAGVPQVSIGWRHLISNFNFASRIWFAGISTVPNQDALLR